MRTPSAILAFMGLFFFLAQNGWSQNGVSLKVKEENLQSVLRKIQKQTEFTFSYDAEIIRGKRVTIEVVNSPVLDVVKEICSQSVLDFKAFDRVVVLFLKEELPEPVLSEKVKNTNVTGRVIDGATGEPLPYALVRLDLPSRAIRTEVDGRFLFVDVPSDTCKLIISYIGYREVKVRVASVLAANGGRIKLQQNSLVLPVALIEENAKRMMETTGGVSQVIINPSSFGSMGGNGEADVFRASQLLPGISGTGENSGGLIIRGSDADQSLVSFDDFTIYHLDHFFGVFGAINTNAVKQIRIHKGAFSARYGGRIAGVVEITGKEGNIYDPSVQLDLGALSAGVSLEIPLGYQEKASLLFTARRSYTDVLRTPVFRRLFETTYQTGLVLSGSNSSEDDLLEETNFFFEDATVKLTFRPSAKDLIQCSAYGGRDKLDISYGFVNELAGVSAQYTDESTWGNRGIGASWRHDFNDRHQLWLSTGMSRYRSDLFAIDSIRNNFFGSTDVSYRNNVHQLLDLSARAEIRVQRKNSRSFLGIQSTMWSIQTAERIEIVFDSLQQSSSASALYIGHELNLGQWSIEPGARYTYSTIHRKGYPELRLAAQYKWTNAFSLKLGASNVHQFVHRFRQQSLFLNYPDTWQLSAPNGLPVLRSDQLTGGFAFKKKGWTFDVEGYYKRNTGTFEFLGPYQGKTLVDSLGYVVGNGWARGIDALVGKDIDHHHIFAAYSLLKTENRFPALGDFTVPELFDQRHELKLSYEAKWTKWEVNALFVFGSGRPYTPLLNSYDLPLEGGGTQRVYVFAELNSYRLPAYHRLDLGVSRKIQWDRWLGKIQFSIFNVYNQRNIRDVRYVFAAEELRQDVVMQGFLPSILLQIQIR